MAAKAPAFQFYVKDWMADLAEHPLEIEGAWCRFCAKVWLSDTPGEAWYTLDQWARLWRTSPDDAMRILRYIIEEKIGDSHTDLTTFSRDSHDKIHLACRRMVREEKVKEGDRIRQRRRYGKMKTESDSHAEPHDSSYAEPHENLTTPSSSASAIKEEKRRSPLPPIEGRGRIDIPPSPEDDPDVQPNANISDLNECHIEFQDISYAFQQAGGCVDVCPAYKAYLDMRYNFPRDRIIDDLEKRCQCDSWKRQDNPTKLSTYLTRKMWMDPIPSPRKRIEPRASPRPRTILEQKQLTSDETAKRLKAAMYGATNATSDRTGSQDGVRVFQFSSATSVPTKP